MEPESTLEIFRGGTRDGLEANLGKDQGRAMTREKKLVEVKNGSIFHNKGRLVYLD